MALGRTVPIELTLEYISNSLNMLANAVNRIAAVEEERWAHEKRDAATGVHTIRASAAQSAAEDAKWVPVQAEDQELPEIRTLREGGLL